VISTTPKNRARIRTIAKIADRYDLADDKAALPREERVHRTKATTSMNRYLPDEVRDQLYRAYAGTRLGAQELEAEILDDLGTFFSRSWFGWREESTTWRKMRAWDLAGTPPGPANEDPDWTVGARVAYDPTPQNFTLPDGTVIRAGRFVIEDVIRLRDTPAQVEQAVMDASRMDGPNVNVVIEREPGQSGKSQLAHFTQMLSGIALVSEFSPTGPKRVRAQLVSGPAQQGRVEVVRASWNMALLDELEEYTGDEKVDHHDDQVDALSMAFAALEGRGGLARAVTPQGQLPGRDALLRRTVGTRPGGGLGGMR
jgi:predicted phage terminase large subunit-like protein